jgi:hypothetical protein
VKRRISWRQAKAQIGAVAPKEKKSLVMGLMLFLEQTVIISQNRTNLFVFVREGTVFAVMQELKFKIPCRCTSDFSGMKECQRSYLVTANVK